MQLQVNGESHRFSRALTLTELLDSLNIASEGVAIAINQQVIPRSDWTSTTPQAADQVDIFQSIAGG